MKQTSKTIVFFGSGPVAAKSLELLAKHAAIEAVVTKPRAQHHRGDVPVLDVAQKLQLPVKTTANKQELTELLLSKPFKSHLGVLIDFGIIVSQEAINAFPLGIVNSHFSLLPEWRGADPITFSVLSGQANTGVSLMLLVEKMDEGPLLSFAEHQLRADITTPELTEELIELSDALLRVSLPNYQDGLTKLMPQSVTERAVSYSRKLTKEDGLLDWHKPAGQLEREIRAFTPWPKSRTTLGSMDCVITKATVVSLSGTPGQLDVLDKQLVMRCQQASLRLDELTPAGKQTMTGQAFLAGYGQLLGL